MASVQFVNDIAITEPVEGRTPELHGVLAVPEGAGPWPGVVMVHEAFGVDDVMRRQVERMAAAGYLVLMPDLFSAGGARRCLVSTFRALSAGQGRPFADIEASRRQLVGRPDCTGAVGVIGFCMGGGFALLAAGRGFGAASVNYGHLPANLDEVLEGACPVVASYGGRDRTLAGAAEKLEQALTAHGVRHDVKVYPTAGHSFLNDRPTGPLPLRPVMKWIAGAGPDPKAAADAWRRIEDWFTAHLGGSAVPLTAPGDQDYPEPMIQLPASYVQYLADKKPSFADAVRPVLMQSAAEKTHGVRIALIPGGVQAHLDNNIPFGEIIEDID